MFVQGKHAGDMAMAHGWSHTRWMQLEQGGRHEERVERRRRMQPAQLLVATRYYDRRPTTTRRAPASRFIPRVLGSGGADRTIDVFVWDLFTFPYSSFA